LEPEAGEVRPQPGPEVVRRPVLVLVGGHGCSPIAGRVQRRPRRGCDRAGPGKAGRRGRLGGNVIFGHAAPEVVWTTRPQSGRRLLILLVIRCGRYLLQRRNPIRCGGWYLKAALPSKFRCGTSPQKR